MDKAKEEYNAVDSFAVIRTELHALGDKVDRFVDSSEKRFQAIEIAQDDALRKQGDNSKTNWSALGFLLALIGALAVLYLAPIKTAQEAQDARLGAAVAAIDTNLMRLETNRARDEDKFDERLQREMRLLNETVSTASKAGKEMLEQRTAANEKRIDDVTNRVDRFNEDERNELHKLWDSIPLSKLQKGAAE